MNLLMYLLKQILISALTESDSNKTPDAPAPQGETQLINKLTVDTFAIDLALFARWIQISDKDVCKEDIADHLLTLDDDSYKDFCTNLDKMRSNIINTIEIHRENEKYVWGRRFEEEMAYFQAKYRTGVSDPNWQAQMNGYKLELGTITWVIEVSKSLWDSIKRMRT